MMGAPAGGIASPVRVLITNGGNHTPETWANETASALVAIDPEIAPARSEAAQLLRRKIRTDLRAAFAAVKATSLASELEQIARGAIQTVFDAAKGSPWEIHFSEPHIRSAMALTIRRNINTAADLALRTE